MAVIKTTPGAILVAAKNILVTGLNISPSIVKISARKELPYFSGDQDFVLRLRLPIPEDGFVSGSGKYASVLKRVLTISIRTRLATDRSDSDERLLLDNNYGHLIREDQILRLFHLRILNDSSNNTLAIEPVRVTSATGDPDELPSYGKVKEEISQKQFCFSNLNFEIMYLMDVPNV